MKKGFLRSFKKFTGKHQCLFFNKVAGLRLKLLRKKLSLVPTNNSETLGGTSDFPHSCHLMWLGWHLVEQVDSLEPDSDSTTNTYLLDHLTSKVALMELLVKEGTGLILQLFSGSLQHYFCYYLLWTKWKGCKIKVQKFL